MRRILVSVCLMAAVASALAQVPEAELAKPPANARHFLIQSTGGKHGDSWSWLAADGARMGRESMNLRGQVFELDSRGNAGADGLPSAITIRGVTPQGDAAETFTISGGTAGWKSPIDAGTASYSVPAFYVSQGGPIDMTAWFLETLLARPDKFARPPARWQSTRRQTGRSRSRHRRGDTDHHALGSHRHQHLAVADVGRHEQQVFRRGLRDRLAAGRVCRRPVENRGGAGESHGSAGAGVGQS